MKIILLRRLRKMDTGKRNKTITALKDKTMRWTKWYSIDDAMSSIPPIAYGIYKIRVTNSKGIPICIDRIGGVDDSGIVYIGRSGFKKKSPNRTLITRIWEFYQGNHSGGDTYYLSNQHRLSLTNNFRSHEINACCLILPDKSISQMEGAFLLQYFKRFGELPPFNSNFPFQIKHKLRQGVY